MFRFFKDTSGWLPNYLRFRLKTPFPDLADQQTPPEMPPTREWLDERLCPLVQGNGLFLGCPAVDEESRRRVRKLQFPDQQGGTLFLYLDTLGTLSFSEELLLHTQPGPYAERMTRWVLRLLRFHLPNREFRIPETVALDQLLASNEVLLGALRLLEDGLLEQIPVAGYTFQDRQNLFVFPRLYAFLVWSDSILRDTETPLTAIHATEAEVNEDCLVAFAALIWSDEVLADVEREVLGKYLRQSGLPKARQAELEKQLFEPLTLETLQLRLEPPILRRFLLEQLVLLALIDAQEAWQEQVLIAHIAQRLDVTPDTLEAIYASVGVFYAEYGERFSFLRDNPALRQLKDFSSDLITRRVKKNLDRVMQEIQETRELYDLLMKTTTTKLSVAEKQKVQEQLLDIAKTIPALAIFVLPGGGLLLPILIKILPFNLLPSSFHEET
ncbi:MAG TPA: hypothetical protein EYQ29_09620 [Candidatus Lambdaproteobacteria bacterium]|jgi:hypothetical protein|nr:hypothetical protein [Candidatus Lambdaproteobacteria bacterium]